MRLMVSILSLLIAFGLLGIASTNGAAGDDRAAELVKQARQALGGEDAINKVKSLSLNGNLRRGPRSGEIQLAFLLPDKFKKLETMSLIADIELVLISILNGDQSWTDSSTRGGGGGMNVNSRQMQQGEQSQEVRTRLMRQEYARDLIGLLLMSPPAVPVEFTYAGEAEAKDARADVLDVKGPDGFAARLYLDKTSHKPLMMQYRGVVPRTAVNTSVAPGGGRPDIDRTVREGGGRAGAQARQESDITMYFADYRAVEGISLPHRISKAAGGSLIEEWEIKKYRVNPPVADKDFQKK
jgi:hypothetical protein